MSTKRKPLDVAAIRGAAVPQPDPVATATAAPTAPTQSLWPAPPPRQQAEAPSAEAPSAATPPTPEQPRGRVGRKLSRSEIARTGRVPIQGYFPESTRRTLKALAANQGRTLEDLLGEAITDLLAKHKAP